MNSLQFMIRVNRPLEISSGIFVYDEIIQMHTIHENNHTVIKELSNGNSKANKNATTQLPFATYFGSRPRV